MRNILSCIPKKESKPFREAFKSLFKFTDIEMARKAKNTLVKDYIEQPKYRKAWKGWIKASKMPFNK